MVYIYIIIEIPRKSPLLTCQLSHLSLLRVNLPTHKVVESHPQGENHLIRSWLIQLSLRCQLRFLSKRIPLSEDLRLSDKSCISMPSIDLKAARSRSQYIVCMSVQQASKSKVSVSPLSFEDAKEPPLNIYKPKEPYTATIVYVERIVGPKAPGETCHIVIDHDGNLPYWEGQSFGVVSPGENPKKPGSPHNVRLYSIASTRYGDSFDGKTASLCQTSCLQEKKTHLKMVFAATCYAMRSLVTVKITGPSGKIMLLPEDNLNATHIMIGTGTGVAPFRGYLRRMFMESVPIKFNGLAWLFFGEFTKSLSDYPGNFRYDRALSQEQKNNKGRKMYVQDKIEKYSDEIFKLLDEGADIYFCGLKGMMPGIQDTLKRDTEERGESWEQKLSQLKKNKQWHVEVY